LGLECQEGQESHLFYKTFGVALGPTQPSTHWVSGALPLWLQRPGSVADHIHLLEKSRISKTTPPLPQYAIHAILTETLGEHAPSYATIKNWVVQFKLGDFSIRDAPRPKTVTTPEIIDQIHELIL